MMGPPRESDDPIYRAMVAAFIADKRNRVIPSFGIRKKRIALDTALVDQEFKFQGDFVYVDYNSTGVAECRLNNTSEDSFPLIALAGVQNIPYDGLYITAAAQPGEFINLWYGYNSQFISPTSAIATIGSITNPVKIQDSSGNNFHAIGWNAAFNTSMRSLLTQDVGYYPGVRFSSTVAVALNGTETVFLAAANTSGAVVWDAEWLTQNTASHCRGAFIASAAAPVSITGGDVILGTTNAAMFTSSYATYGVLRRAVRIPAGVGLFYYQGDAAAGAAQRKVHYTLF